LLALSLFLGALLSLRQDLRVWLWGMLTPAPKAAREEPPVATTARAEAFGPEEEEEEELPEPPWSLPVPQRPTSPEDFATRQAVQAAQAAQEREDARRARVAARARALLHREGLFPTGSVPIQPTCPITIVNT